MYSRIGCPRHARWRLMSTAWVVALLLVGQAASAAPQDNPLAGTEAQGNPLAGTGSADNPFDNEDLEQPRRFKLPRAEFLEKNYIFYDLPNLGPEDNKPLIFEAQVAPHFFFLNEWHQVERQADTSRFLHALSVSILLRLRMVGDDSTPVRPLSFMPRLDYQLFRVWRLAPKQLGIGELRLTLGHHSNGQQYCAFGEDPPLDTPGACQEIDTRQPDLSQLNYKSGNFSTNYVMVGARYARLWLGPDRFEDARISVGVVAETNPTEFGPGGINAESSALYGPHRLKLELEASQYHANPFGLSRKLSGVSSINGSLEVMLGAAPGVAADREMVEVNHIFDRAGGFGLFARFVTGQDYLNILYAAPRIATVQVGVVWDLSPRLQYVFKPGGESLDAP
jgi:hypothetical protein